MVWDAQRTREARLKLLPFQLQNTVPDGAPVGNFGKSDVTDYIELALVGLAEEGSALLTRGNQRIDAGLAVDETFGSSVESHWHRLHQARALGAWLTDNLLAAGHWDESRRFLEGSWRSVKRPWTRQEIVRDGLDLYMPLAVLGGLATDYKGGFDSFRAGIDMYEHWSGEPKLVLGKVSKPRELGYVLCRHYLNFEYDRNAVLAVGRKVLSTHLETGWLDDGKTLVAAMWLMIVYWYPAFYYSEELSNPVAVLLKAYDDMPKVSRPG